MRSRNGSIGYFLRVSVNTGKNTRDVKYKWKTIRKFYTSEMKDLCFNSGCLSATSWTVFFKGVIFILIKTKTMHTFFINDLNQLCCLRHVSKQPSVTCTCKFIVWFMHRYVQSGGCGHKLYHKTACASLPEDEHLLVRIISKTI